jgi:capsular exopolysaccharide synthesis family protein
MIVFLPFPGWQQLVGFITSATVLAYGMAPLALGALRYQEPDRQRPFKLPFAVVLAPLGFVVANEILLFSGWAVVWKLVVAILIGFILLAISMATSPPDRRPSLDWASAVWLWPYLIGIAAISYLDDRLIDLDDVRSRLGITALGEVRRAPEQEMVAGQLLMRDAPTSAIAEDFRSLRTNISFANVDHNPRLVLVTSAQPGEGKTLLSANLALAFAQAGVETVLVDADLRRSAQRRLFKLESRVGLTDLVAGSARLTTLEPFRVASHLFVIHSGSLPPNPAEVLSSNRMFALLQELLAKTDGGMVIVDTSPILVVTDPIALAPKVDGCLLVVDSSQTLARSARRAIESLRAVHAVIIGGVLNKVQTHGAFGYEYPLIDEAASQASSEAAERQGRATM